MQREISELRAAVEILTRRVEALEIAVGGPVGEAAGSESGYSVVDPPLLSICGGPEDRGQLYQDLADWLVRGVSGHRLGLSARDRPFGANRAYLLVRDCSETVCRPVRVFRRLRDLAQAARVPGSRETDYCPEVVFLGFPCVRGQTCLFPCRTRVAPELESFRDFALVTTEGIVDPDFPVHVVPTPGEVPATILVIVIGIAVVGEKLLVAVLFGAWSRKPTPRAVPPSSLSKATAVVVAASEAASGVDIKVWIGYLSSAVEGLICQGAEALSGCYPQVPARRRLFGLSPIGRGTRGCRGGEIRALSQEGLGPSGRISVPKPA